MSVLSQKLLGAPTIARVSARSGGCWWRELKVANQPAEINKNGAKNGQIPTLSVLKLLKTPFFSQKYLIRYSRLPRNYLRNTLILRFFVTLGIVELYVPVQSFISLTGPHSSGLVLRCLLKSIILCLL